MLAENDSRDTLSTILSRRLIAVLRFDTQAECAAGAAAVAAGGISVLEVTLTTPGALEVIRELALRGDVTVGVGSVRNADDARRAADAGARFMASPITNQEAMTSARERGLVTMPGALTPAEIDRAWRAGADLVKVFPMPRDGAAYIRAVLGPMPDIRLAPSGGVTPFSAREYLDAGASVLNVGSWLTHDAGRIAAVNVIRTRSEELVAAVRDVVA